MAVQPNVRNLVVCHDMWITGNNITLVDLVLNIDAPSYPKTFRELCVFAVSIGGSRRSQALFED